MLVEGILKSGIFLKRSNRFLVILKTSKGLRRCHLRDPGRLSKLLRPGAVIIFRERNAVGRKTDCEVLLVWDRRVWTIVNSSLHNDLAIEVIESGLPTELGNPRSIKREFRFGNSRIDFLLEDGEKTLLEVKGCTLVRDGLALFPDAPSERGKRHVLNLIKALKSGYRAAILFLVMRPDAEILSPNWEVDPEFSSALTKAAESGVMMLAVKFAYKRGEIIPVGRIPVKVV